MLGRLCALWLRLRPVVSWKIGHLFPSKSIVTVSGSRRHWSGETRLRLWLQYRMICSNFCLFVLHITLTHLPHQTAWPDTLPQVKQSGVTNIKG